MELTGNVIEIDLLARDATGWAGLLAGLRYRLEQESEVVVDVRQVKEKFGGLRFYAGFTKSPTVASDRDFNLAVERAQYFIQVAETASLMLCYVCGAGVTKQGSSNWIRYFCDEHDTHTIFKNRTEELTT